MLCNKVYLNVFKFFCPDKDKVMSSRSILYSHHVSKSRCSLSILHERMCRTWKLNSGLLARETVISVRMSFLFFCVL